MGTVISVNAGEAQTIIVNQKGHRTGIFKYSVKTPLHIKTTGVQKDTVVDTRVHGGVDKAVYLYPSEHYAYWKNIYPNLDWQWGMFGENLTTKGLIEKDVHIGSIYQFGETVLQVSQPRQPCYKLGYRFNNMEVVKQFKQSPLPGIYFRVLEEGYIKAGDSIKLLESKDNHVTLVDVSGLLAKTNKDSELLDRAINDKLLAKSAVNDLIKLRDRNKIN